MLSICTTKNNFGTDMKKNYEETCNEKEDGDGEFVAHLWCADAAVLTVAAAPGELQQPPF